MKVNRDPAVNDASHPLAGQAVRVLRQFRIIVGAVRSHFQQIEEVAGISGAQIWALHIIQERPGLGVSELARAMDIRQPTASNLVKALVGCALVQTRRDGPDLRVVRLHTTVAGKRTLRKTPGPFDGVLPQALRAMDERSLSRLEEDLARFIEHLGADTQAARIPLGG